jgi:predicted RNA binding protein YcfA (HicA-like mRNA interferase family)
MPKLPIISFKDVIRILRHLGFEPAPKRGKGSHSAFVKKTEEKATLSSYPIKMKFPEELYFQLYSKWV